MSEGLQILIFLQLAVLGITYPFWMEHPIRWINKIIIKQTKTK